MSASKAEAASASVGAPIGGFFESHKPDGAAQGPSVLGAWTAGRPYAAFVNARSAFAALAASRPRSTIWLPAFLCADLVQPSYTERIAFFPVGDGFEPDVNVVSREARGGDLVLIPAYFGVPASKAVGRIAAARPDLEIVEDCAQALDPGPSAGAAWRLHSPRKLLGVADGGMLVAASLAGAPPQPTSRADSAALWAAPEMRAKDRLGERNGLWHAANQAKEAAMAVSSDAMTQASCETLAQTSLASLTAPRLKNWGILNEHLSSWSALAPEPTAAPFGYVLRLEPQARDHLLNGLHARRIFAAVHWPRIAAPAAEFSREAGWTRELITLPCDHRYGPSEMARIAEAATELLR